jgi:hypothetical protein
MMPPSQVADAVVQDGEALAANARQPLIRHYLIGNNNIGEDDAGGARVAALARMVVMRPDIETWFLAGNHLDKDQIKPVAKALERTRARYARRSDSSCLRRLSIGSAGLTDVSLPLLLQLVKACPVLTCLDLSSYKSTNYFGQTHNQFTRLDLIVDIGQQLKQNATAAGKPLQNFIGLESALDLEHLKRSNVNLKEDLLRPLFSVHHLNVNMRIPKSAPTSASELEGGASTPCSSVPFAFRTTHSGLFNYKGVMGESNASTVEVGEEQSHQYGRSLGAKIKYLIQPEITEREFKSMKDPHPALDHIQSIYRNTMKA